MRRNIAAGNWKMNTTVSEGVELIKELEKQSIPSDVEMIICAPATHLSSLVGCGDIQIGGQNIYMQDKGAFTGEISPYVSSLDRSTFTASLPSYTSDSSLVNPCMHLGQ